MHVAMENGLACGLAVVDAYVVPDQPEDRDPQQSEAVKWLVGIVTAFDLL